MQKSNNTNIINDQSRQNGDQSNEVPINSINLSSGLYGTTLFENGVAMMASDWIPTEPLPPAPEPDREEYLRQEQRLNELVPTWAMGAKRTTLSNYQSPSCSNSELHQSKTSERPIR